MKGLSLGDTVMIKGEVVNFDKWEKVVDRSGFEDTILCGGRYKASTTLLDISCGAGRWGMVDEINRVKKVGHFKGTTLASYLKRYLTGDFERFKEGDK